MEKIIIGFSGGLDSATLLGILLGQGFEVHSCTFYYGSKHGLYENRAAENIINYYQKKKQPVFGHTIDLQHAFTKFSSALLNSGGNIPEGHYKTASMKQTIVPGRNLIFASIMSGLAESIGAKQVALGMHSGDNHIYPDCRPEFISALNNVVHLSSEGAVKIIAPLLTYNKTSIIEKALILGVPIEMTRTCYKYQPIACGKCGSCVERLEGFKNLGLKDPIQYEHQ